MLPIEQSSSMRTPASSHNSGTPEEAHPPPQPPPARPKRSQVARACDWCRVHRIKCDHNHPCYNCRSRGAQCSNGRTGDIRTLPHAFREIERLRQRIQQLENELERERERSLITGSSEQRPGTQLSPVSLVAASLVPPNSAGESNTKCWKGIHTSTARSSEKTWYGPSSLLYFISQMNIFVASTLKQHLPEAYIKPNSASRLLDGPTSPPEDADQHRNGPARGPGTAEEYLTPTQEEYFIDLFWQSYHTSFLMLNEIEFKEHYRSLWAGSKQNRKPSALVDIVIAVCMQYGMARSPRHSRHESRNPDIDTNDATIAGRWHYHRSQSLLTPELESPTISTLQCNVLSVIWLCCASFQNMADSTLAVTVRMAQMLGLHMEPPEEMPPREKELRRSLWWTICVLETKTSMKLGRPFLLYPSLGNCRLPDDDYEIASLWGSNYAPLGDNVTWLSWNVHNTKLVLTARRIYTAFHDKYSEIFNGGDDQTIHDDSGALEEYAGFLVTEMKALEQWASDVPGPLKTRRQDKGVSYSTDCSALAFEQFAPLWVQRQRLLLELLYHNLCTNLYRPFISFKTVSSAPLSWSLADSCADKCASHAMALTYMIHQILAKTDILTGWQETFQWQWNNAMTMVGYVLAYPNRALTGSVREAVKISIAVLEMYGNSFAIGTSAANAVRGLNTTVDKIVAQSEVRSSQVHDSHGTGGVASSGPVQISGHEDGAVGYVGYDMPELDEEMAAAMQDILDDSMDMAFTVDGYHSSNVLWPNMGFQ
ncbi:fungal-specific transcription factor domain-containing protein [Xylariomycetidae sp. FL2044]|nr:fungal-specific transcription factor domain-containing protein [Xylariomycetidae sp. FL2044]